MWRSVFSPSIVLRRVFFQAAQGKVVAQNFLIDAITRRVGMEEFRPDIVLGVELHSWFVTGLVKQVVGRVAKYYKARKGFFFLKRPNRRRDLSGKNVLLLICSKRFFEDDKKELERKLQSFTGAELFCLTVLDPI
ncbi:hypothetical protein [Chlamydiifrater phoenicopteri]|uniref:hypothetical protein n=1 Tax=Chlamydiifrater phoenicopteri TaxID=2681469 RepID=UPI001BCD577E|nr:hypothetical protein [Chlamydiifrater phoenicopteri]